jgi:hypothetical protein
MGRALQKNLRAIEMEKMSRTDSAELIAEDTRWIIDSIAEVTDDSSLGLEMVRLESLIDRLKSLASNSSGSDDDLMDLQGEFFAIILRHPKLKCAYFAQQSNTMVEIAKDGIAHLSGVEKTRPLDAIELGNKEELEKSIQMHQADLKRHLDEMRK